MVSMLCHCVFSLILTWALSSAASHSSLTLLRSKIVTKDSFRPGRRSLSARYSDPAVPPPFTVTTSLRVKEPSSPNRQGKTLLTTNVVDQPKAILVEGVRMPDDKSDRQTWRNGRVIGNKFFPDGKEPTPARTHQLPLSREAKQLNPGLTSSSSPTYPQARTDYSFNSGSHVKGRPIYYVVEEPDSLHSDRSPYAYEPADPSLGQSELPSRVDSGNTFADPQAASDYVIKEHTYSMCPGCPTFSIPIPVPKGTTSVSSSEAHPALNGQAPYDYEASAAEDNGAYPPSTGFLGQITSSMLASANKVKELAAQFLSPFAANSVELQAGLVEKQDVATNSGVSSQLMAGGLAAALVGGLALLSSAATLATFSSGNPVSSLEARKLATPLQRNSACFFARTCQQLQSDAHTSEIDAMLHKITNQFCERVLEGENPCS